jgi:partial transposase in ISPg6
LKGSKKKTGSTHILSAWVDEVGLSLDQETVAEKRNDLSGAVISIDAIGTQNNIAEQIINSSGA